MKTVSIMVPGSVITHKTAADYLLRIAERLLKDLTMESSIVLGNIGSAIVSAGFLTWEQVEQIEIEALQ